MRPQLLLIVVLLAFGCGQKPADTAPTATAASQPAAAPGGGSDEVRPIGPNIGPMTPVAGGENLGGGTGGGLGQRAKDMARNAASQSSQSDAGASDENGQ